MPNSKSAEKRLRQNTGRRLRGRVRRSKIHTSRRKFDECIAAKDFEAAQTQLSACFSSLDRAAKARAIHPNKASRTKARLVAALRNAIAGAEATTE